VSTGSRAGDVPAPLSSVLVLGTGALGAFYGARLARAGCDVHFVARADHDAIARSGLRIDSCLGDFTLPRVNVVASSEKAPPCDLVLVALKTTANGQLRALLPSWLPRARAVCVLQNGLGVEAAVAELAGGCSVVGGMCFVCVRRVAPGHVRHTDYGWITLAEHRPDGGAAGITPAVRAVAGTFARAGIDTIAEPDLPVARWKKLVWNVPYNGLCTILGADTRVLMHQADTRALVRAVMGEVVTAASAGGHAIDTAFIDEMLVQTDEMAPYAPSMWLDAQAGRPLELDAIYAAPLAAARAASVATPRIEMLHQQLRLIDSRRSV
jgi:2-dehydropantoate 2-reductase